MGGEDQSQGRDVNGARYGNLYAAGLNAHGQLQRESTQNQRTFAAIREDRGRDLQLLFTGWSTTVLVSGKEVFALGHQTIDDTLPEGQSRLVCGVGDHDGMICCLDQDGRLYLVEGNVDSQQKLRCRSSEDSPRLGHVALAQNGRVAITSKQTPNGQLCHAIEFSSFDDFIRWYEDPSGNVNYPDQHHMLPGRPKQLLANTATFIILMEGGEVYTWGDGRYQSLGRPPKHETIPVDKPVLLEALDGIKIRKVASGGWMSAALSEDGALYIWGAESHNDEGSIKSLVPGEVALVELPNTAGAEPLDVLDVAVGDHHIAVVAEGSRMFVVGDNRAGQSGIGSSADFAEDWQEAKELSGIRGVFCGPKATFALTT